MPIARGRTGSKGLAKHRAQAVAIESSYDVLSRDHDRTLDKIGVARHQLYRLGRVELLVPETHFLEGGTFGIQKIPRVESGVSEQRLQFRFTQRISGVVAFVELDAQVIAQETSCVAASR